MKYVWMLAAAMLLPAGTIAQSAVLPGTILPIRLNGSLDAGKAHAGQQIRATVMQEIPGTHIHRRAQVLGHVVQVEQQNGQQRLVLTFDSVRVHGQAIPLKTDLRALASLLEVEDAQIPEEMSSRGITPETATTEQIGGEQDYHGGASGFVAESNKTVGQSTYYGAVALPRSRSGEPCRGELDDNSRPQALWLFSSNACGVYGYNRIRIVHAGRTDPEGTIILSAEPGQLKLISGSGMLLRVQGS